MKLREVGRVRIESDRTIWRQTGIFGRIKAKGARGDYIDLLTRELPEFADMSRADALIESAKRYHPDLYDEVVATLIKEREEAQKKTALEKAKKAAAIEAEAAKARLPQKETSAVAVPESKRSRILSPEEIRYEKNVERGKARLRTQEGTRRLIELAAAYSYSGWNLIAMAGAESETAMLVALPRMGEDGKFHLEFSAPQPSPGPRLNITHADFDEVMRRIRFRGSYGGERGLQTAKLSELMARVALGESPRHDDSLMREVAEHPMIIDAARSDLFEAREDLERERERKASLPPRTPEKQIEEARGPERWRGRER